MMSHYMQMKACPLPTGSARVPGRADIHAPPIHTTGASKDTSSKTRHHIARWLAPWARPAAPPTADAGALTDASRLAAQALQARTDAVARKAGVPAESIVAVTLDSSRAVRAAPNLLNLETLDAPTLRKKMFAFLTSRARGEQHLSLHVRGKAAVTAGHALHDLSGALEKHLTRLNPAASRSVIDNGVEALMSCIEVTTDRSGALQMPNSGIRVVVSTEGEAIDRRAARHPQQRRNALVTGEARVLRAPAAPAAAGGFDTNGERITRF